MGNLNSTNVTGNQEEKEVFELNEQCDDVNNIETIEKSSKSFEGIDCGFYRLRGRTFQHSIAILMAFLSGLLFTINNFVFKGAFLSSGELLTVRSIIQILLMSIILFVNGEKFWPKSTNQKVMVCLIGLLGSLTMLTSFVSVKLMPVPDAITLMFTAPLFTMVFSAIFLKDKITSIKAISGLVLMVGIVLVTQPTFLFHYVSNVQKRSMNTDNELKDWSHDDHKVVTTQMKFSHERDKYYFIGAFIALSSAVFGAAIYVITTKMGKLVTTTLQLLYMALSSLLIACFLPLVDESDRFFTPKMTNISAKDFGLYVGLSCSGIFGFWLAFRSCRMIKPSIVSTLRTTEIVVAFIAHSILTNVAPEPLKAIGATFILLAALALIFEKALKTLFSKANWKGYSLKSTIRKERLIEDTD